MSFFWCNLLFMFKDNLLKLKVNCFDVLSSNLYLQGIQRGLMYVLPLVLTGAFVLCFVSLPFPSVQKFQEILFGAEWQSVGESIIQGTFGITSLALVIGVSFGIAELRSLKRNESESNARMTTVVALACYITTLGPSSEWGSYFSLGPGLIMAVFTAVSSSFIFCFFCSLKRYRLPLAGVGHDPITSDYLIYFPAGALTILLFAVGHHIYSLFFADTLGALQSWVLHLILDNNISELGISLLYTGLSQILWLFGVHGPNVLFVVEKEILSPAMVENAHAAAMAMPAPHIVTKDFLDNFALIGGSGSTLALIIAILLKAKEGGTKRLCMVAVIPAICSINEPLLFGIPLVFNPVYAIPFVLTPLVQTVVAYLATAFNLVAPTIVDTHWSMPVFLSGYVTTQSFTGVVMQLVNIGIGVGMYIPFVGYSEELHRLQARESLSTLLDNATDPLPGPNGKQCLTRPGFAGYLARTLADDLAKAISDNKQLFFLFQPQVDAVTGQVRGVESLLRWDHPVYGYISPPVIIALAEDIEQIDALGNVVLEESCNRLSMWQGTVPKDFLMSVNLSAKQLRNPKLAEQIMSAAKRAGIPSENLQVEITETLALTPDDLTFTVLNKIHEYGVKIAIDDFGMGHTSFRYLKDFPIDTVKIDRSLTIETADGVNDHIVKSILHLTNELKIKTVVEGVETIEQLDRFMKLGCSLYQGFYFSKGLDADNCLKYITDHEIRVRNRYRSQEIHEEGQDTVSDICFAGVS